MMRRMYDSVTWSAIPTNAQLVAGYINGTFKWPAQAWARFPNAVKVRIATRASVDDGHVLDVEPGDATPAEAPGWVVMRRKAGVDPSVYCGASAWEDVIRAFHVAGVAQPHYWVAHYDGKQQLPVISVPGIGTFTAVAKQYADPARGSGGNWDSSIAADHWPGVDKEEVDVPLSDTDIANVWDFKNPELDKVDMRQRLVDAANGVAAVNAAVAALATNTQKSLTAQQQQVAAIATAVAAVAADVAALKAAQPAQPVTKGTFTITGSGTVG